MGLFGRLVERLKAEEGCVLKAYKDSLGVLTIAYGFNLERPDADRILLAMGLSPTMVRSGTWPISVEQADELLNHDAARAITDAGDVVGQPTWNALPETAKLVCADMTYQLGYGGFGAFHKMIAALRASPPDFGEAAHQMRNSRWAMQTPERCKALAVLMEGCAAPAPPTAA